MVKTRKPKQPAPQVVMVTDSCGCVYCDLELEPEKRSGRMVHKINEKKFVVCTKTEALEAERERCR